MPKCIGCGVRLQNIDESKIGYIPSKLIIDESENLYCKRCFQIIHNGKKYQPVISDSSYYDKIAIIGKSPSIVILMIDVMNIYSGFIPNLVSYIKDNPVIVVVNKTDLLPKSVRLKNLEERIKEISKKEDLNLFGIVMISAKMENNIDRVLSKINSIREKAAFYHRYKKTKFVNTYIIGMASVGKSTFINAIKRCYLNDQKMLTTSDQYQTTLDFIKVYINKDDYIIDTPGLVNKNSFGAYLDYESLKILTPKKYIKPKTYQLNEGQTIFIGGLCQIDFETALTASFYVSNDLYLHRTKSINASEIFKNQVTKLLIPPLSEKELEKINKLKVVEIDIQNKESEELIIKELLISGIGFIHLVGKQIKTKITVFEKIAVDIVDTFI